MIVIREPRNGGVPPKIRNIYRVQQFPPRETTTTLVFENISLNVFQFYLVFKMGFVMHVLEKGRDCLFVVKFIYKNLSLIMHTVCSE